MFSNRKLYFLFLYLVFAKEQGFGMTRLGYTEQQTVKKSLEVSLRKLHLWGANSQHRNYSRVLPINIKAEFLERFLSSIDPYDLGCFNILQRVSVLDLENLKQKNRENFEFKLASSHAAYLSSTVDLGNVEDSVINRISTQHPILDGRSKTISVQCAQGTDLIADIFSSGALSRPLSKSEISLVLRLRMFPKKWCFFWYSEDFDKSPYIEAVAASLRALTVQSICGNEETIQELRKYLKSEYEVPSTSIDMQRGLQQYCDGYSSALSFDGISESKRNMLRKAFLELDCRLSNSKELEASGVKLDNELFSAVLNFFAGKDNLFHIYNPIEFSIINLIYPEGSLTVADRKYWRDSIIGSHRAKFIIENAEKAFSFSEGDDKHSHTE